MTTHSPAYHKYLKSFTWHLKRHLRMIYAGHKCELCGNRKGLQCHHRTYIRLYREKLSDLQILCENCHKLADEKRRYSKALQTYCVKRWGAMWPQVVTLEYAKGEFDKWLKSKE